MAQLSNSEIIKNNPIGSGLDSFRSQFKSAHNELGAITLSEAILYVVEKNFQTLVHILVLAFPPLRASYRLPSKFHNATLVEDIARFIPNLASRTYDVQRTAALCKLVIDSATDEDIWDAVYALVTESTPPPSAAASSLQRTPSRINTGSFLNSSEYRKDLDDVLKEELRHVHVGVPGFFDALFRDVAGLRPAAQAVFEKCKAGDDPLYQDESGWQRWPEGAKEGDVLSWFSPLIDQFLDFAGEHRPVNGPRRRLLTQPNLPFQGSTASRKLDIGFVDDANARVGLKPRWSQILVPGELKSNPSADKASRTWLDLGRYAREALAAQDSRRFVLGFTLCGSLMRLWQFDRLGAIASEEFNINEDGLQFVSIVLGFLWMKEEQLGFDPTIITVGNKRYVEIEREDGKERLVIDKVMKRVPCVAGRGTTCWKVYREDHPGTPLVVKDSWQYPEREEEGKLLREASQKKVVNVARYFHHETVRVGGQDDDVRANVRKGLDITTATNYMPEGPMPPPSTTGRQVLREDGNSSAAGRKRPLSSMGTPVPPSKRIRPSSPTEPATANRVHRRIIISDYGKAIYKASSPTSLLTALEGCIEGYESLHTRAGMLQCDISPNNLMMNEDDDNSSSCRSFLIDLDLAVRAEREKSSGARAKTGTRAFMAIGVLLDTEKHSFMHDLESFFWVLFWICTHYDGPGRDIGPTEFEKWNYMNMVELAEMKTGLVAGERHFLNRITKAFTPFYQRLIPHVNRLRRVVFPKNGAWEHEDGTLYSQMIKILRTARTQLEHSEQPPQQEDESE